MGCPSQNAEIVNNLPTTYVNVFPEGFQFAGII